MKAQEIYNKIKRHLLKQNAKSLGVLSACAYRGINGHKCAVGCLIPDKLYKSDMDLAEDTNILTICDKFPKLKLFFGKKNLKLLDSLQNLHDNTLVENWKLELQSVAKEFNLKP